MIRAFKVIRKEWVIILILIVSFILRLWNLTYQSLWLDELHNMNEADPDITWGKMFYYLNCCDQHPPLYFIVERLSFTIFGHTEFVARIISAIAGTLSIWAVWLLGREILNRSLGIIAAILTCVNYYNLFYSQEARGYIFAFLFATLSFVYFIKLIKFPDRKNALLYSIFSLGLLYSHYYSLFVIVAQGILALLFLFMENGPDRKRLFKNFLLGFIIIAIGYIPWLPFLSSMSQIESFWIDAISPAFMTSFFYDYFGNAELLKPFIILLLLVYIFHVSLSVESSLINKVKNNPLVLSFSVFIVWIFITYLIPYIRSLLVVPMLFPRYTIVVLPAIILALAYGIELFKLPLFKYLITAIFVIFSLIDIFFVKKYYTDVRKTQFREMTAYVVKENTTNFPIINQLTAWQQHYYFKKFKSRATVITGSKDKLIDSIVNKMLPKWQLEGFWIVGAHGEKMPDEAKLKELSNSYVLLKQKNFYDAWAQLFISKTRQTDSYRVIGYNDFAPAGGTVFPSEERIVVWGGSILTKPVSLQKGTYDFTISASGTKVEGEFPHLNIYCNEEKIADYHVSDVMKDTSFKFENRYKGEVTFKIDFDNDLMIPGEGDRNAFLKYIILKKI